MIKKNDDQAEPVRLFHTIAEAIVKNDNGKIKDYASYIEVATGERSPQVITDDERLYQQYCEAVFKKLGKPAFYAAYAEVIHQEVIEKNPMRVYSAYLEAATGERHPQDIIDSARLYQSYTEAMAKTPGGTEVYASYIEIMKSRFNYDPVINIQILY